MQHRYIMDTQVSLKWNFIKHKTENTEQNGKQKLLKNELFNKMFFLWPHIKQN